MASLSVPLPQKLLAVDGVLQEYTKDPPLVRVGLDTKPPVRRASSAPDLLQFLRGAHASVQTSCTPPPPLQGAVLLTAEPTSRKTRGVQVVRGGPVAFALHSLRIFSQLQR